MTLTVTVKGYAPVCTLVDMKTLLKTLYDDKEITHRGAYLSLRAVLTAAEKATERHRVHVVRLLLRVYSQQVTHYEARGWISAEGGTVLRDSARCVLRELR